jgi:hypothetical protein
MLSVGVCSGALILKLSMGFEHHAEPRIMDFSIAFLLVSLISLSSTRWHVAFAPNAGHELSGHRAKTAP